MLTGDWLRFAEVTEGEALPACREMRGCNEAEEDKWG